MSDVLDVMPAKIIDASAMHAYYIANDHLYEKEGKHIQQLLLKYFSELLFTFDHGKARQKIPVLEGGTLRDYNLRLNKILDHNCPFKGGVSFNVTHEYYDEPKEFDLYRNEDGEARVSSVQRSPASGVVLSKILRLKEYIHFTDLLYKRGTTNNLQSCAFLVKAAIPKVSKVTVKSSKYDCVDLQPVMSFDVSSYEIENLDELFTKVSATMFLSYNSVVKYSTALVFEVSLVDEEENVMPAFECHRSYNAPRPKWLKSICYM